MFAIGSRIRVSVHHSSGQQTDHGPGLVLAVSQGIDTVYTVQLDSGGVPRVFGAAHLSAHIDWEPEAGTILVDPTVSHWLKQALKASLARDCVDAARDAELLARVLRQRALLRTVGGATARRPAPDGSKV